MKVLVTGGAGFIGSHLVDELRERGAAVIAIDSLDPGVHRGVPSYLRSDVEYCFADLRHLEFDSRFEDVEAVVHLAALGGVTRAAREPANIIEGNAGGTARLVAASRKWPRLKRLLLVSSFSVYGANYRYRCPDCGNEQDASRRLGDLEQNRFEVYCRECGSACDVLPIKEDAIPNPLETYGASKYMQELCLRGITHCSVGMVRLSSVYGTRLRLDDGEATIIAKLAGWIRSGVTPKLFEDGRQLRDWVYVGDVVATLMAMLERPTSPPVVNVCSGLGTSLLDASAILSRMIGLPCQPNIVGGFRPGDMRHCLGDDTHMRALIGRSPLPFSEGAEPAFSELAMQPTAVPA